MRRPKKIILIVFLGVISLLTILVVVPFLNVPFPSGSTIPEVAFSFGTEGAATEYQYCMYFNSPFYSPGLLSPAPAERCYTRKTNQEGMGTIPAGTYQSPSPRYPLTTVSFITVTDSFSELNQASCSRNLTIWNQAEWLPASSTNGETSDVRLMDVSADQPITIDCK